MHRAQNAYTEVLSLLNSSPRAVCLLQEPYLPWDPLPRHRGFDVFPSTYVGPRTAIYSPRFLKYQEISHFCHRDCTAVLLNCGARDVILASVYMDIHLSVDPPWLVELLHYADQHSSGIILAVDTNAHSTVFGPDQNPLELS